MSTQNNPHDSFRTRDHVRTPSRPSDVYDGFIEAVRPFHRVVCMVAFAGTKSRVAAERIAVEAFSAAFKLWKCERPERGELEFSLIRIALSEARKYIEGQMVEDIQEDICDLVMSQTSNGWRPYSTDTIPDEVVQSSLMRAIEELSVVAAVTLLLRDAFHLSPLQISRLIGESQPKVKERVAYGRVSICIRLAEAASGCGHGRRQRVIATC